MVKTRGKSRAEQYDVLYSLNWGEITTNNFGFAPADGENPKRFQLQMYQELYKLLQARGQPTGSERLLEISCGCGGGLDALLAHLDAKLYVVGLDFSAHALAFCRRQYSKWYNLRFVRGSALQLPFDDGSFNIVLNVEAAHAYGDYPGFFREVHRVLGDGGAFLFADYRKPRHMAWLEQLLREAGFEGTFHDITENVVRACELDSARRERLIRSAAPWYVWWYFNPRLRSYARLKGSSKLRRFQSREQIYIMTCMSKVSG